MEYNNKVVVEQDGIYVNGIRKCSLQNAREYLRGIVISTLDIRIDISEEFRVFLLSRIRM